MKRIILIVSIIILGGISNFINSQTYKVDTINQVGLPFIGKMDFETRPGVSGFGTPSFYIEIQKNGDTYFGFEQTNNATKENKQGRYYVGKFKTYMKCVYKDWDNEVRYYKVTKEKIYEVDNNNNLLTSIDCCTDGKDNNILFF